MEQAALLALAALTVLFNLGTTAQHASVNVEIILGDK
jgi:hypothetical protein